MMAETSERVYINFEPTTDLISENECETVLLHLPGFKKEQLKVQVTPSRVLRVFGERPIGGKNWNRFHKEFQVPSNIEITGMTARFEGGILYIRQPKVIPQEAKEQQDHEKTAAEAPAPELKTAAEAPAPEHQQQATSEEKTEKKEEREEEATEKREKDDLSDEKTHERKERSELHKKLAAQAGRSSGLFKELKKPENLRKLVVYVILLLILAYQIIKTFKSSNKVEEHSIIEHYDHQEL